MAYSVQLQVYDKQRLLFADELAGPIEMGRQRQKEQGSYRPVMESGRWRVSIARTDEQDVSRRHALIEPLDEGHVRVTNLSEVQVIRFEDGGELAPEAPPRDVQLPAVLLIGGRIVRLEPVETEADEFQSLGEMTCAPGQVRAAPKGTICLARPDDKLGLDEVLSWVQATMSVLHSAASSSDFFDKATQAAKDLVGLDCGQVLLLENGEWKVVACHPPRSTAGAGAPMFSQRVLNRVRQEKKTFWQVPSVAGAHEASLKDVRAVVAAPILDRQGQVIGALYGDRSTFSADSGTPITGAEALLVELLATGVAAGLARVAQEKAALTARVQFEQFFTPELAHHLTIEPDLLKGRDAEVTLLFCDIRGFSRFSERLGPARTVEWISDVMNVLSESVLAHRGVLVDYIGDELIAMWGTPETQADHAQLAGRSAVQMLERLPELNRRWEPVLQGPMDLGIGLNSGTARVGNTGSQRKFKYGPLGNTVNLASRVQGATKYLKVRLLATGATHAALGAGFQARRLGRVRVVNIAEPVALYELAAPGQPGWAALQQGYEQALAEFEAKEFRKVIRTLGNLLVEFPGDGPSLILLSRAVNFLVVEPDEVDPVWELPGK